MKFLFKIPIFLFFLVTYFLFFVTYSYAIYDPLSVPNNKFGIHIISATDSESSPAAGLVNSSGGDWGYITVLAESKDRDVSKWQQFFNDLRKKHLIPLVRLATQPEGNFWKRPYPGEEEAWAGFLGKLIWPTKNRYVIVYNEPNQAKEWGNSADPADYARTLDKTITALKKESEDFYVLNAGFDASAPQKAPNFFDESLFIQKMNEAVPGIFNRLDGWSSHSYPNPGFIGSPDAYGKGSIRTWFWEIQELRALGITKNLPIFITETGWRHAEGINTDPNLPSADKISKYYKTAFENSFSSPRIAAVTPFLLNYQENPFDHFSFKKITGEKQKDKILAAEFPEYYPQYQTIKDMPKIGGQPVQENKAELVKGEVYSSIVSGESYEIKITFKNTGQSIWNDGEITKLAPIKGGSELGINTVFLPVNKRVEPGQEYTFTIKLKAPTSGSFKVALQMFKEGKPFESTPVEFTTEVKSPVILKINASLDWKKHFDGIYALRIAGIIGNSVRDVVLDKAGKSQEIETKDLLPDYTFDLTLQRPFYKPKLIHQKLYSGVNVLDFGSLQPDIPSAILHPLELWKLLPWSD